ERPELQAGRQPVELGGGRVTEPAPRAQREVAALHAAGPRHAVFAIERDAAQLGLYAARVREPAPFQPAGEDVGRLATAGAIAVEPLDGGGNRTEQESRRHEQAAEQVRVRLAGPRLDARDR